MGRRLQTVAASAFLKTLLMVFNLIFWISGFVILAMGVVMKSVIYTDVVSDSKAYSSTSWLLIGTGLFIVLIGSLACFCTMKNLSYLLYAYSFLLMMIFVVELGAGLTGYFYRAKVLNNINSGFHVAMQNYGTADKKVMVTVDMVQNSFDCCGATNYTDWFDTTFGKTENKVPESCCTNHQSCSNVNVTNTTADVNFNGCVDSLYKLIADNIPILMGITLGFAGFQLFGVLLSYMYAKHIHKIQYERIS